MPKKTEISHKKLVAGVLEGLQSRKAKDIVNVDLTKIEQAICQNFIICHGDSTTHVAALADSVDEYFRENYKLRAYTIQGLENAQWVLLDYIDVVVHIFQKEYRDFYHLEDLWADAKISRIESE